MSISIVTFLWREGYRDYRPEHVNILANACRYFLSIPHRFICVTDETEGFCDNVEVMPVPKAAKRAAHIPSPHGKEFPSSYRRLWCFSEEATVLGDRILLLDVDCMVVGDLSRLLDIDADFVGWRPLSIWGREQRIGGGTWLLKTGTVTWLWEKFMADPVRLIEGTREMGWNGSDQAILSRFLRHYPQWPQRCGIYGSQDGVFEWETPPQDALIVHFNGGNKPWTQWKPWIRAYCRRFYSPS